MNGPCNGEMLFRAETVVAHCEETLRIATAHRDALVEDARRAGVSQEDIDRIRAIARTEDARGKADLN